MSNQLVTVDNITDAQIRELRYRAIVHDDHSWVLICDRALAGSKVATEDVVAELNRHDDEQARHDQITTVADLIIELQRATSEYQARVADISSRIVDAAKGE